MPTVVRNPVRTAPDIANAFAQFGVATIHESQSRTGLLSPRIRPIYTGARAVGTAVTVSVPPGDNWMIHVAIEQCRDGDLLVVAPTSLSVAGYVGELIGCALVARGVRGLVIDAGCRDVAELRAMGFPVWSRAISAQGTVKQTLGDVNLPLVCGEQLVEPGDVVVCDDDGVVVVRRRNAAEVLEACAVREAKERESRRRYMSGELGLDVAGLRQRLERENIEYLDAGEQ